MMPRSLQPNLEPQRLCGHQERSGKAVHDPFRVQFGGNGKHDVAEFVGDDKPLALAPVVGVYDDEGNRREPGSSSPGGKATETAQRKRKYLYTSLLQEFNKV